MHTGHLPGGTWPSNNGGSISFRGRSPWAVLLRHSSVGWNPGSSWKSEHGHSEQSGFQLLLERRLGVTVIPTNRSSWARRRMRTSQTTPRQKLA